MKRRKAEYEFTQWNVLEIFYFQAYIFRLSTEARLENLNMKRPRRIYNGSTKGIETKIWLYKNQEAFFHIPE